MPNLYAILGVDESANADELRAAYRSLAREFHPDNGGDASRMAEVNAAWQILGDEDRRRTYDAARGAVATGPAGRQRRGGSTVLDFGRYAGWTLAEVARTDDDYLTWLRRTPMGHRLQQEIDEILTARAQAAEALRPQSGSDPSRRR